MDVGGTWTATVSWRAAKFAPVSVACTASVDALTLADAMMRAEKRNVFGAPLTRASESQHRRDRPATAPGALVTWS